MSSPIILVASNHSAHLEAAGQAFSGSSFVMNVVSTISQLHSALSMTVPVALLLSDEFGPSSDLHEVRSMIQSDHRFQQLVICLLKTDVETAVYTTDFIWPGADDCLSIPVQTNDWFARVQVLVRFASTQALAQRHTHVLDLTEPMVSVEHLFNRIYKALYHEFRNPLASIVLGATVLSNYVDQSGPETELIHQVIHCSARIRRVLDSLVAIKTVVLNSYAFGSSMVDLDASVQASCS